MPVFWRRLFLNRPAMGGERRKCSRAATIEALTASCLRSVIAAISATENPSIVCRMNTSRSRGLAAARANSINLSISSEEAMSSGVATRRSAITLSRVRVSSG